MKILGTIGTFVILELILILSFSMIVSANLASNLRSVMINLFGIYE
jgi:hypothetical protein